jgi:general nucleoside transport system permease protein
MSEPALVETATALLAAGVRIAVPLLLLVLGEIYSERAGVVNIGLEGLLLAGAFSGFAGALVTGSVLAGFGVAILCAALLAALHAYAVVVRGLDQIVSGLALNVLSLGLTGVFFRAFAAGRASLELAGLGPAPVPLLSEIPLAGPAFFRQSPVAYLAYALVPIAALVLYRTRAGLVVRAAGENPAAVDSLGYSVARVRFACLLASGALAGIAGAYLSTSYTNTFVEGMSDGRGFLALAIVVFARWDPWRALGGALLFGCAAALGIRLQGEPVAGVELPYQLFQALPYLLTLAILAFSRAQHAAAPPALGTHFRRE